MTNTQLTRSSLHSAMQALHERSAKLLDSVDQSTLDSLLATPLWSCSDVLRHLLAWNSVSVEALKSWQQDHSNTLPDFEEFDQLNAYLLDQHRHLSASEARQRNNEAHASMLALIDAASDQELAYVAVPPGWHSSTSMLGLVDEMIKHDHEHLDQIEAALAKAK